MILKELLDKHNDKEITERLFKLYRGERKNKLGYEKALKELRALKVKKNETKIIVSTVRKSKKFFVDKSYIDVSGFNEKDKDKDWEGRVGIEFTKWENWLGMEVKSVKNQVDTLAHILWEMTFSGYSNKSIQREWKKLTDRAKEAMEQDKKESLKSKKSN